jgi:hypothetical protein
MQGIARALVRLLVMGVVVAGVLGAAVFAGVATTTAIAIGIVMGGIAGLVMAARSRPRRSTAADEIAAIMASENALRNPAPNPTQATAVEAMAPPAARDVDPESNMPRWRRPSLLEARRSDPSRQAPAYRLPMRFTADQVDQVDVRIVRYAVVPILDKPDEILGRRVSDLEAGDEVQIIGASAGFLEVHSPNGDRGWVHRTTLGQRQVEVPAYEADGNEGDAVAPTLSARGLI